MELVGQAISKQPENPYFLNTLEVACMCSGRLEDATNHFRDALRLREAYPDAHANLGQGFT